MLGLRATDLASRAACRRIVASNASGLATFVGLLVVSSSGFAFEINTGTDLTIRWDNTVKYSAAARVRSPKDALTDDINTDDGNRNFDRGLISNRFDLLSELDVRWKDFGARISGAAWYDFVYNDRTDNGSPATYNPISVTNDRFPDATRDLHGRDVELLDALTFGRFDIGESAVTYRVGRFTQLWGESLFFTGNGIANGQAPVDVIKALSVPNTQAKELFMPVWQMAAQLQALPNLSIGAYYQFAWRKTRIPGVGSYFSDLDFLDAGGERILTGPGAGFHRENDIDGSDEGQFGVSVRYRPDAFDADLGIYALKFNDRVPQVYLRPGVAAGVGVIDPSRFDPSSGKIGGYQLVYADDIKIYGASISTTVGNTNVAGEISYRHDTPLVSTAQVVAPGMLADNDENALYAIGNSIHAQVSAIHLLPPSSLWDGGNLLAEIAGHRLIEVTRNRGAVDPNRSRYALGLRAVLEPAYFQVAPGLDMTVPIGLGYNFLGKSPVDAKFNGNAHRGGDLTIGVNFDFRQTWKAGISYTHYFGDADTQTLLDRDFVAVSVRRSF